PGLDLQNGPAIHYHPAFQNVWMLMNQNVFKLTLPILFGYLPLGMAFGVLFTTQLDHAWWIAPLMGLVIYAGAGQILAVSLLAANAGLVEVAVAMFVLNARHLRSEERRVGKECR